MKQIIFSLIFLGAFGFLFYNLRRIYSYINLGQPENRFDNPAGRIQNVIRIALGQSKLLREPLAGIVHFLIFWGFLLFLFAVVEAVVQGFLPDFSLRFLGPLYSAITFSQDIFGLLIIAAVFTALYRRFISKVPRLNVKG
ncbi:MAG: Fe-S oxidoreductase, partial [Melioribacteraceae bacterium]